MSEKRRRMSEFALSHLVRLEGLKNGDYNGTLTRVQSILDPARGRHLVIVIESNFSPRL